MCPGCVEKSLQSSHDEFDVELLVRIRESICVGSRRDGIKRVIFCNVKHLIIPKKIKIMQGGLGVEV